MSDTVIRVEHLGKRYTLTHEQRERLLRVGASASRSPGEYQTGKAGGERMINSYRDLDVYRMAMKGAMAIFVMTKGFPLEERYSLTDQIRRASRSVCANLAETWRKRRYKAAFVSKLSDAETEAAETQVWLEMAFNCGYLDREAYDKMNEHYDMVMGKLVRMIDNPAPWLIPLRHEQQ